MADGGTMAAAGTARQARAWALAGLAGVLLLNLQLAGIDHPPLIDWANHLARHGLHCGTPGLDGQAAWYDFALRPVPNLAGDLVHLLDPACADPVLTRAILVQWATAGLVAGVVALHAAIWRRLSAWPLVAALVAHNMALTFGFENYVLAAAAVPWALALWVLLERGPPLRALAVFLPVLGAVYLMHLYAFGFLGAVIGARALARALAARTAGPAALRPLAVVLAAAAPPLAHLAWLMSASAGLEPGNLVYGDLGNKVFALLSPVAPVTFPVDPPALQALLAFSLAVPVLGWLALVRAGHRPVSAPGWGAALAAALALTLAMPTILDGIWFSDIRFPTLLACLLIATTDPRLGPRQLRVFVPVLLAVFGLRCAVLAQDWRAHDREMTALLAAASAELGPGDRLATARVGLGRGVYRHSNSAAVVGAVTGAHVPSLFQGANTLSPKPRVGTRHVRQGMMEDLGTLLAEARGEPVVLHPYLQDWRGYYSHLLLIGDIAAAPGVPDSTVLARTGWFALLRLDGG